MPDPRWTLDPDTIFLNHGSFGACPVSVLETQSELRTLLERDPVRFFTREIGPRWEAARDALASLVGVHPDGLVFVSNATTGVNSVLRSLPLSPGDEIVLLDHGYPACQNAARFVAERAGAAIRTAAIPFPITSPQQAIDALLAQITSKTRLVMLDHVSSPTGLVLPIAQMIQQLDGIDVLVDGAHAPGMLDLDVSALGCAYYTGNCHKWLCAPKGAAFLWVREDKRAEVRPVVISHGASETPPARFHREFDWLGTDDPTAVLSIPAAIDAVGDAETRAANRELALRARAHLLEVLGLEPPAPEEMIGSLAAILLPPSRAAAPGPHGMDPLHAELYDRHRIQVPVFTWPRHPQRVLRMSAQRYNRIEEYQALAKAVKESLHSA